MKDTKLKGDSWPGRRCMASLVRATVSGPRGPGRRETSSPSEGDGRSGRTGAQGQMQDFKAVPEPSSGGELEPSQAGGGGVGECEPSEADEPASAMMRGRDQEASRRSGVTLAAVTVLGLGPWGDASSCGGCSGSHLLALA
jgi:hypothetical protein